MKVTIDEGKTQKYDTTSLPSFKWWLVEYMGGGCGTTRTALVCKLSTEVVFVGVGTGSTTWTSMEGFRTSYVLLNVQEVVELKVKVE